MDLSGVLQIADEDVMAAAGGLLIGLLFGACAQRSRFCLRSACVEFGRGAIGGKVAVWLLAFAAAVAGTQTMIALGRLDVSAARQLSNTGSLSGAIIGGALFGVGMVLARGCSSRLLVLSATGNLRALLSGLIFVVTAQSALRGVLSPLRDRLAGLWTVSDTTTLNLLDTVGLGSAAGPWLGGMFLVAAVFFAARNRVPVWGWIGSAGVGSAAALAWLYTYSLSQAAFDVVPVEAITFTGPSADTLMLVLNPPGGAIDFDIGLVPGVFLGSFLAALASGELRLEGFQGGAGMRRYIAGAVLMGFGGMLAGGCAVGAGLSGGSIFALTAWVTLTAMWAAAMAADAVIDRDAGLVPFSPDPLLAARPCEHGGCI